MMVAARAAILDHKKEASCEGVRATGQRVSGSLSTRSALLALNHPPALFYETKVYLNKATVILEGMKRWRESIFTGAEQAPSLIN